MNTSNQSEFNMAVATLERLHYLRLQCIQCKSHSDYWTLYSTLDSMFIELGPYIKKDNMEIINKKMARALQIALSIKHGQGGEINEIGLITILNQVEKFFIDIMYSSGILNKMKDTGEAAMGRL